MREYLYQSITDKQLTIRALDVKAGFLFIICFSPIAITKDIVSFYGSLADLVFYKCTFYLMISLWLLIVYILLRVVLPIKNPASFVTGDKPNGTFFSPGLYRFNKIDLFFNFPIQSTSDMSEVKDGLPSADAEIEKELVFEKIKLAYIRDIKSKRLSACIILIGIWIAIGLLVFVLYLNGVYL